jgi:hypothetical protein
MRYVLDRDDDGHWYLIAESEKGAFNEYVYAGGAEPPSMIRLSGHPNNVSFEAPLEFGKPMMAK